MTPADRSPTRTAIEYDGVVTVVAMTHDDNRLHPALISELGSVLDELQSSEGPAALVLTGSGKFFSNGLDLEYMAANPEEAERILLGVHALLGRLLGLDLPTVAAVNGHAFAAGAMLALAFDQAVIREDRGFFCLPEAELGLPFTPGMTALIRTRLSAPVAHEAMVTARRYGGPTRSRPESLPKQFQTPRCSSGRSRAPRNRRESPVNRSPRSSAVFTVPRSTF
jgi:enoyl-CoA hydratase/carnithine racemase